MKSSFSIRFYLKDRPKKDGLHPIVVCITINGQRASFNSQQDIRSNEWDRLHSRVIGKTPRSNAINLVLDVIKADLVEKYNYHHILRREPVNAKRLRSLYLGTDTKPSTLIANFDFFNNTQEKIIGKGVARSTHNKYTLTRRRLHSFLLSKYRKDDISMDSIDLEFIMNFERYLRDEFNMANNSVEKLMRIFRRIVMLAVFNGIITIDPFKHYRIRLERVERHYLTQEELDRIINKKFTVQRIERVKDLFLFCCYTGLSYVDAVGLNKSNLEVGFDSNKWLILRRQKTGIPVRLRLLKVPSLILEKYASEARENLLLPMGTNQRMNGYLKEIADCCRIHKQITFHTARHTFATTITLSNGMPLEAVSKMLGHTKISTTQIYARIVDKTINDEIDKLATVFNGTKFGGKS